MPAEVVRLFRGAGSRNWVYDDCGGYGGRRAGRSRFRPDAECVCEECFRGGPEGAFPSANRLSQSGLPASGIKLYKLNYIIV